MRVCIYVTCILSFTISCFAEAIIVYPITCDSLCTSHPSSQPLCTVKSVHREPMPMKNDITAQAPNQHSEGWYVYDEDDGSQALALNISWSHNRLYFLNNVTGYVITIISGSLFRPYIREFSFHPSANTNSDISRAAEVMINYPCFGRWGEVVRPDLNYVISLKSLPLYHSYRNIQVQEILTKVHVPDCSNENVSQVKHCKVQPLPNETDDNEDDDDYESSSYDYESDLKGNKSTTSKLTEPSPAFPGVVVALVVFVIAISTIIVLIYVIRGRRAKRHSPKQEYPEPNEDARLLILVNSKNEERSYLDAANALATMLGEMQSFNLWHRSRIIEQEEWTAEELRRCMHVVFICTPKGKQHYDEFNSRNDGFVDAFIAGMHRHTDATVRKLEATAVYFDKNASTCIPENLSSQVQRFQVTEQFDKFIEHIRTKTFVPQCSAQLDQLQALVDALRNDGLTTSMTSTAYIDNNFGCCASENSPMMILHHQGYIGDNDNIPAYNSRYDSGISSTPQSYKTSAL